MAAPEGNNNYLKGRPWTEALRRIDVQSEGAKLRKIAEKVYEMAEAGDLQAIREIAERTDGKAAQALMVTGADDGPVEHSITVKFV